MLSFFYRLLATPQRFIRYGFPLLILAFIVLQGRNALQNIEPMYSLQLLRMLDWQQNLVMLLVSFSAVASMFLYDWIVSKKLNFSMTYSQLFRISWISNTFNNVMGFGGLSGGGLRVLFYKDQNASLSDLLRYVTILSFTMLTGLSVLSLFVLTGVFPVRTILSANPWMYVFIVIMALYIPFYLSIQRLPVILQRFIEQPVPLKLSLPFIVSSFIEWTMAAAAFSVAGSLLDGNLSFQAAAGVFILAGAAGALSTMPGGFVAFDVTALVGLQLLGTDPHTSLSIVILFRLYYYVIPWILSVMMGASGWVRSYEKWPPKLQSAYKKSKGYGSKLYSFSSSLRILGEFGVWSLSLLVFLSGLILLLSAATLGITERLNFLSSWTSPFSMALSRQATVVIGIVLVVLSKGIKQKITRAFNWTLAMLAAGAFFSLSKGMDYEEASFLLLVGFLLWLSKDRFYRKAIRYPKTDIFKWMAVTSIIAACYVVVAIFSASVPAAWIPNRLKGTFVLQPEQILQSAVIDVLLVWAILGLWFVLKKQRIPKRSLDDEELAELEQFLKKYEGNQLTHLLWLKDKQLFWGADGTVLIPYSQTRNTFVALGEPIGERKAFSSAIGEFRKFADMYGMTPVFYQATGKHMQLFHEHGYRFFKLGEEAVVRLEHFTLKGRSKTDFRTVRNKLEREGMSFQLLSPPLSNETLEKLSSISDSWLDGRKEKGFSLGWFDEEYLQKGPVAVVQDANGEIVAFANLMVGYDNEKTVAIDLMRYASHNSRGIMDYLFVQLILWAQEEGYETFSLGMAPLASVGHSEFAHKDEKIAKWVAKNMNQWYGFQGLRRYKQKFEPEWKARYFIYPASRSLVKLMLEVTALISEKPKPDAEQEESSDRHSA